jgi:hypothetical protein
MIDLTTGKSQTGLDVRRLKIRQFVNDLFGAEAVRKKIKDIANANPHPADARASAALLRINRNPIGQSSH